MHPDDCRTMWPGGRRYSEKFWLIHRDSRHRGLSQESSHEAKPGKQPWWRNQTIYHVGGIRKTKKLLNWYLAHLLLNKYKYKSKNKSIHPKTLLVASKFYLIHILIRLIYT
jgi:hypothetical protein